MINSKCIPNLLDRTTFFFRLNRIKGYLKLFVNIFEIVIYIDVCLMLDLMIGMFKCFSYF